jgi:hypothetical protein
MPTFVDLAFGSTTFDTSDVRLMDFALNPGGQVLRSLSNSPLFIYSLDYLQNDDYTIFITNDVTLSSVL